jgi:hypothetical protein
MATTTATIMLNSTDLLSDELALSTTATLTGAGNSTGLTNAAGLSRKTTTSTSPYGLFPAADYTVDKAHKLYLKNTSTTAAQYFLISVGAESLGRLYAGDWAFLPWSAASTVDIAITPSHTSSMTLEYMLFTD